MLTAWQDIFGVLRELAHDGIAVCGAIVAGAAVIATSLSAFGLHISELDLTQKAGAAGAVIVILSKFIDSWHDTKTVPVEPAPVTLTVVKPAVAA